MRFYRINSTSWCFPFPRFSAGPFPFFSMPVFEGLRASYRVPIVCYRGLGGVTGFYFLVLSISQVFCWSRSFPLLFQPPAGGAAAWRPAS